MLIKKNENEEVKKNEEKPVDEQKKEDSKCPLSKKIQELLVRQLKHELQNHNIYMNFANYFGTRGLTKLEQYFVERANEEYLHHTWIRKYLNENDVEFVNPVIDSFDEKIDDMLMPFEATVELENYTTELIHEITDQAFDERDWLTFSWLTGNDKNKGMLLVEQVEEMSISRTVNDIAHSEESWLVKEKSILYAYEHRD